MPVIKKPKSDTLDAMGLQAFLDDRYYRYGGYVRLDTEFTRGTSDSEIARIFGRTPPTIARWRAKWEGEKDQSNA